METIDGQAERPADWRCRWLLDTIGAVAIAHLFIVTIMAAVAQQEVVARLKDSDLKVSWTSGLALAEAARKKPGGTAQAAG